VIVDHVHVAGVAALESEHDPPVSRNIDSPETSQTALKRMKAIPRQIHLLWHVGLIKAGQNSRYLVGPIGGDAAPIVVLIQSPEPTMPKISNHETA
jgi:hypothetical protein